ncbi:MAG: ADP-forming succinate--CoA ligase subunit beta [Candidatus Thermoplasmatota archaeon]|nr:ADP-forming succinate--CoA ligase subunit beta [Candidatus Thermoplasmatota archaeon]
MDLLEYRAKEVFSKYSIPVPKGFLISKLAELPDIKFPVVLKAQVPVGGRGKAGGIKFAGNKEELEKECSNLLGASLLGYKVDKILVEEKLETEKELYLSISIDRSAKLPLLMASECGGVDIEEVEEEKIIKTHVNPFIGIQDFNIRELILKLNIPLELKEEFSNLIKNLYSLFKKEDAELAEINPLVITRAQKIIAADAKLTIDSAAMYRHKEYESFQSLLERKCAEKGIAFVKLDGNIGVIANGAGLTMATLDCINYFGGKPGVFLDLGGGAEPERVKYAFELMLEAEPKAVFINIFGGITRCDEVALGLKEVAERGLVKIPVAVRMRGTNEKEGKEILEKLGITTVETLEEGAERVISLCQ